MGKSSMAKKKKKKKIKTISKENKMVDSLVAHIKR